VGDCFAVGLLPHEVSADTAKAYRDFAKSRIAQLQGAKTTAKQAPSLLHTYTEYQGFGSRQKDYKSIPVERGAPARVIDNRRIPSFDDVQRTLIARLDAELAMARADVARMTELIDTWTEQPLTTLEVHTARVTAELKVQRDAKKAERDAKKAEGNARRLDREAKLAAKIEAATTKARALLDAVDPSDIGAVRRAYLKVVEIKLPAVVGASEFVEHYLGRTELLKSAGLVRPHNGSLMSTTFEVQRSIAEACKG
jgi:hypothetical protein